MKLKIAAFALGCVCAAHADVYTWNASVGDGAWEVPANWTSDTGNNYPGRNGGTGDSANLQAGTYTIHLTEDVSLVQLGRVSYGASAGMKTLDAGGNTVNVTASGIAGYFLAPDCSTFVFSNGTLNVSGSGFQLGGNSSASTGALVVDDAEYSGRVTGSRGCRLIFRNCAVYHPVEDWKFPTMLGLGSESGILRATGNGTRIDGAEYSLNLNLYDAHRTRFEVLDGAEASVKNLTLGADASGATNIVAVIDNGSLQVGGYLRIGMNAVAATYGHELHVRGDHGHVSVAGSMKIMQLDDNRLYFAPGPNGYVDASGNPRPALAADSLTLENRTTGPQNVYTRLFVSPEKWMFAHPGETIELVRLATPSAAALQALVDNVVFDVSHPDCFDGDPSVEVSVDGRSLLLAGACRIVDLESPAIEVGCGWGESDGTEVVNVRISSYGMFADSAWISVSWADALSKLGTVAATDVAKDVLVCESLPAVRSAEIAGLGKDANYYARVVVSNELGAVATNDVHFISRGDAESFEQKSAVSSSWQDVNAWTRTDASPTSGTWPMPGDSVSLDGGSTTAAHPYTLTLSDHAGCASFLGKADFGYYLQFTLFLNGFDFFVSDEVNPWSKSYVYQPEELDLDDLNRWILLKGPGTFDASKNPGLDMSQSGATGSCGELRLENGVVYKGCIRLMNNGSRVFVRSGAIWQATADFTWQNTKKPYGYVCVSGETSRVSAKAYAYTAGNAESGFFALDGGTFDVGAMNIGTGAFDGTFLKLDRGNVYAGSLTIGGLNNVGKNARIDIAGRSCIEVSETLSIYDGMGTVFSISIPEEGLSGPLMRAGSLVVGANWSAGASSTVMNVACERWVKNHPKEELTLVELSQPNALGLDALASQIAFVGWDNVRAAVNADGTKLNLIAGTNKGFAIFVR